MKINNEVGRLLNKIEFQDKELKKVMMEFCDIEYKNVSTNQARELYRTLVSLHNHQGQDFEWNRLKFFFKNVRALYPIFSLLLYFTTIDYLPSEIKNEYILAKTQLTLMAQSTIHRSICEQMDYPHSIHITKESRKVVINVKSIEVFDLLVRFIDSSTTVNKNESYRIFLLKFEESLQKHSAVSIEDLSYDKFKVQYIYFANKNATNVLFSFYYYLMDLIGNMELFPRNSGILYEAMKRHTFSSEYAEGYRAYYHNPLELVPISDKWILIQSEDYKTNNEKTAVLHGISKNFEDISLIEYRVIVKEWMWKDTGSSFMTKSKDYTYIVDFLNFISSRKMHKLYEVSIEEVIIFKSNILSTVEIDSTIERIFNAVKVFLDYCCDTNKFKIEKNVLAQLAHSYARINKAEKIADEDLVKIANIMKDRTYIDMKYNLYYAIFYLLLESEMRLSHILALETDSIRETIKKNQYIIEFQTKSSNTFEMKTSITRYVKKHLDSVISSTALLRNECHDKSIKKRIFLQRNINYKIVVSPMRKDDFNKYLKSICVELGIKPYTAKNLRDTHMTKSVEYTISKGLHQLTQSVLTGHKNIETTERHYLDEDISEMFELLYETQIGDITLNGEVLLDDTNLDEKNIVENGCGYCRLKHCKDDSYFSCLICKEFATFVSKRIFFEERIKEIDFELEIAKTRHDVEDLQVKKQLLLAYLKKIYLVSTGAMES